MKTDEYFEIKSELEVTKEKVKRCNVQVVPDKEKRDYMGEHVYYWFTKKDDIINWVKHVSKVNSYPGTISYPRFGGNFIDVEPEAFEKFITWVWDDAKRVAIAGWTGNIDKHDLTIDEIMIDPKEGVETKSIRRKAHISRVDETSDTDEGYVRCWWD